MAKFNKTGAATAVRSPVTSEPVPAGRTHEGAPGYARDAKGELFLLAVTNMGSEDTFYEKAAARDSRYAALVRQVAAEDLPWLAGFRHHLRRRREEHRQDSRERQQLLDVIRDLNARLDGKPDDPGVRHLHSV